MRSLSLLVIDEAATHALGRRPRARQRRHLDRHVLALDVAGVAGAPGRGERSYCLLPMPPRHERAPAWPEVKVRPSVLRNLDPAGLSRRLRGTGSSRSCGA
jgi:hypothetical protein